jgi:hypothetical protein
MSYLNLHIEAEKAKQRLTQVFEEQQTGNRLRSAIEDLTDRPEQAIDRQWLSPEMTRPSRVNPWKKGSSSKRAASTGKDMSSSSFALTLLLAGTIAAANTDQPLFWLSIGPVPLAIALGAAVLFRSRFDLLVCLLRKRSGQSAT